MFNEFDQWRKTAAVLCRFRRGMLLVLAVKLKQEFIGVGCREKDAFLCVDLKRHVDLIVDLIKSTKIGDRKNAAPVKAKLL